MVHGDRREDGHLGVHHVGRVPGATHTDLDNGSVDRGISEGGVRHPDDGLEEGERVVVLLVDEMCVRRHVVERPDEGLLVEGFAVQADPLGHRLQVRAGEPAGAQPEGHDELLDHPGGRGLAVGAGEVDRGVGALGVAEHLHEGLDAVQGRVEPGLGPAAQQRVLDLGVGLGEAGVVVHREESRSLTRTRFRQDEVAP